MELYYNLFNNNKVDVENKREGLRFTLNHKNNDSSESLRWSILYYYKPVYFFLEDSDSDKKRKEMLKKRFEKEIKNLEKEIEKYKMLVNICTRKKIEIVNNIQNEPIL